MDYAKVENGNVVQVGLPETGEINGNTVSNYHLLPVETLFVEGWLPLIENKPAYDTDTQELQFVDYTVAANSVTANYHVVDKPVEIPSLEDIVSAVETDNEIQNETLEELFINILPNIGG